MGIKVRYEDPLSTGALAIVSGKNKFGRFAAEMEQRERMAREARAAQFALQQQQIDAQRERDKFRLDAERGSSAQALQDRMALAEQGHGFDLEKMKSQQGYDREKQTTGLQNDQALIDYRLSAQDKLEEARLNAFESKVRTNPNLTEDERRYAFDEIDRRRAGLKPQPYQMTPEEYYKKNTFVDENGNTLFRNPQSGAMNFLAPKEDKPENDKFQDPRFIADIMDKVRNRLPTDATDAEVQAEFRKDMNRILIAAGKKPLAEPDAGFSEDPGDWTPEQRQIGLEAEQRAQKQGITDPLELVKIRNAAAAGKIMPPMPRQSEPMIAVQNPVTGDRVVTSMSQAERLIQQGWKVPEDEARQMLGASQQAPQMQENVLASTINNVMAYGDRNNAPVVNSPEEARRLPRNSFFRDPQGNLRKVP